ncbi:alpha/beta fold hydrolase [Comamonas odontotermitis]|uniref:alpha/beta fold hydrolase n=1 Tax=Comamonas odontotermitis TaxID=379895 RepID=UPI001CC6A4E4|nr:alpha/beta hydrolase [Comamonas odontotermitis]UBB15363.1 alpha/beta hydrolase [Comamonas odontotermitis]
MFPSSHYTTCAGYEVHFMEWGARDAPVVIAWHGLARTGRDMDDLAAHLSGRYRVICPDTLGRGLSQWATKPEEEYCLAFYARLAGDLFERLGVERAHWIGTSMGGAIGTVGAAGRYEPRLKGRIRSLLLNDNAPRLADEALARIKAYAGRPPVFDTVHELEAFFREVYLPYGWLSDAQWRRLTETSMRRLPDGRVTTHYDPDMVQQFTKYENDYLIWDHYDALDIPVMCLRGEHSDLVLREVTDEMLRRGPGMHGLLQVVEVPNCGHAPALNTPRHYAIVDRFLAHAENFERSCNLSVRDGAIIG